MSIPLLWSRLGRALLNSLMSTITRGVTCYKRKYIIALKNWSNQPSLPELLPLSCCWMRQPLGHSLCPLLSPLQPGIGILKIKYILIQQCNIHSHPKKRNLILASLSSGTTMVAFSLIRLSKAFFSLRRVVRYACSSTLPLNMIKEKNDNDDELQCWTCTAENRPWCAIQVSGLGAPQPDYQTFLQEIHCSSRPTCLTKPISQS